MKSQPSTTEPSKPKNLSELSFKTSLNKKIDHHHKKFEVYLKANDLDLFCARKIYPQKLRFDGDWESSLPKNPTMRKLTRAIQSAKNLQELDISCEACFKVTEEGFYSLCGSIKRLSCLKKVNLAFNICRITNRGMKNLGQALKALTFLHDITLNFSECREINDVGLNKLSKALKKLVSLRSINLDFHECPGITDKGMLKLSQSLKKLNHLQSLFLDFGKGNLISQVGLYHLGQALRKRAFSLKEITLNFRGFDEYSWIICDIGIQNLCLGLERLASLQSISLDFSS